MAQQLVDQVPQDTTVRPKRLLARWRGRSRGRSRGQVIVIFALSSVVFVGMCAVVVDVAWYWSNNLRVQRAADAAALAGAVLLPGNVDGAVQRARAEATKNGYTSGGGVTVTPCSDANEPAGCTGGGGNDRQLNVTISAPVNTFFMRVFGINSIMATRTGKAEFVLPVPMGSPQNWYGVGLFIAADSQTQWRSGTPAASCPGCTWTNPGNADGNNNNLFAQSPTADNSYHQWANFGLLTGPDAIPVGADIDGIEVQLNARRSGSGFSTDCDVEVALSWNNGVSWAPTNPNDMDIDLGSTEQTYELGGSTQANAWTGHTWTRADFDDAVFRVRLTFDKPSCSSGYSAIVDTLYVRISTGAGPRPVVSPAGDVLAAQNFWGAMQSQGAPNIQGDAFMTKYDSRDPITANDVDVTEDPDAVYDPSGYYNYGVEMPPGATGGEVWIFDPGFCAVSTSQGTGESWTTSGANGYSPAQPVSAYYDLYDTRGTPYDPFDDGDPIGSSGNTFRRLTGSDPELNGTNGSTNCSAVSWHNGWWQLASGLTGGATGTIYRVHTYSTDFSSPNDQNNTTALNSFAIWATASATPRVYGNGAMEAYVRLPGGQASTFYLAQIEAAHAGKSMVIDLWDPGDTGSLSAVLRIRQPTASGYTDATFSYQGRRGTTDDNASSCDSISGTGTSVTTNTGGFSRFNGCWLRMIIELPINYTAPTPPGEPGPGWWKIQYTMGGSTSNFSTDLTTWKVAIRGNPVHLVVP